MAGNSVQRILDGYDRVASRHIAALEEESRRDVVNTQLLLEDQQLASQQRITGINQPLAGIPEVAPPGVTPSQQGNFWLDIGTAGLQGLGTYADLGGRFGNPTQPTTDTTVTGVQAGGGGGGLPQYHTIPLR